MFSSVCISTSVYVGRVHDVAWQQCAVHCSQRLVTAPVNIFSGKFLIHARSKGLKSSYIRCEFFKKCFHIYDLSISLTRRSCHRKDPAGIRHCDNYSRCHASLFICLTKNNSWIWIFVIMHTHVNYNTISCKDEQSTSTRITGQDVYRFRSQLYSRTTKLKISWN